MLSYLVIDIETSGLDPSTCQILELAAIAETGDWLTPVSELPRLHLHVHRPVIHGEPFALAMHRDLLAMLAKPWAEGMPERVLVESELSYKLERFVHQHFGTKTPTVAGKNYGTFDSRFLERLPFWHWLKLRHRVLDVGNHWFDPVTDDRLPDTETCLRRAGLAHLVDDRPHQAVADCEHVVELMRAAWRQGRFAANWSEQRRVA